MTFNDLALGLLVAVFGGAVLWIAGGYEPVAGMAYGPGFFPSLIGIGLVICGAALAVGGVRAMAAGRAGSAVNLAPWWRSPLAVARAASVLGAAIFYILVAPILGFHLTLFLVAAGLFAILAVRWWLTLLLAVLTPAILAYVFGTLLRIPLPRGPVEVMLGG
jgi:putative tricarboxylic transport membrane protein